MRKRNRIILWSAAVLVVLGLTVWLICPSGPPDPIYNGHRLSWWVSAFCRGRADIPDLDSNAVPYLIQSLKAHDGLIDRGYSTAFPHFPDWLQNRLSEPDPQRRRVYFASQFLGSLGPTARPAIPDLLHVANTSNDPVARMAAIDALSQISTRNDIAVVQCLAAAARDKDPDVRYTAGMDLERLDPKAVVSTEADLLR